MRGVLGLVSSAIVLLGAAAALGWPPSARHGVVGAAAAGSTVRVSMKEFMFIPASTQVHAGDTVTWTYDESASDPMPNCESVVFQSPLPVNCPGHSTTSADKGTDGRPLWDSGVHRASGFPYAHTFTAPGTYHYYCVVHGGPTPNNPITHMDGVVVVLAAPAAATPSPSGGAAAAAVTGTPNTGTDGGGSLAVGAGIGGAGAGLALVAVARTRRARAGRRADSLR